MKNSIRIILADDHQIFRDGFTAMFKANSPIQVIGEAKNGEQLISKVESLQPDVVLTDIKMPDMDGLQATHAIHQRFPQIGIIALSMFDDDNLVIDMLEAGALGYLLKNASKKEITEAIKTVNAGQPYYCNHISVKMARLIAASRAGINRPQDKPLFTEKEIETIRLVCQEYSNKEIAETLFLSVRTIEGYRKSIMEKANAKNVAGLVVYAIRHNIFKP